MSLKLRKFITTSPNLGGYNPRNLYWTKGRTTRTELERFFVVVKFIFISTTFRNILALLGGNRPRRPHVGPPLL